MFATISIINSCQPNLFEHFLDHYSRLDTENFYCCFHSREQKVTPELEKCINLFGEYSTGRYTTWLGEEFSSYRKLDHRKLLAAMAEEDGIKWKAYLDADEFYLPPGRSIPAYIQRNEKYDAVMGILVDRLAPSSFAELTRDEDIFSQFPLNAFITNDLLGGVTSKVFIHRGELPVSCRGHHCIASASFNLSPEWLPCYHFKWDSTVIERLENRMRHFRQHGMRWWIQSERFLQAPESCWQYVSPFQQGEIVRNFRVREWIQDSQQEERRSRQVRLNLARDPTFS